MGIEILGTAFGGEPFVYGVLDARDREGDRIPPRPPIKFTYSRKGKKGIAGDDSGQGRAMLRWQILLGKSNREDAVERRWEHLNETVRFLGAMVDPVPRLQEDMTILTDRVGRVQDAVQRMEALLGQHFGGERGPEPRRAARERDRGREFQPASPVRQGRAEHQGKKLELPIFHGEDPYGWLFRAERGRALGWFQWAETQEQVKEGGYDHKVNETVNVVTAKTTEIGQKTWGIMKGVMAIASQKVEEYTREGANLKADNWQRNDNENNGYYQEFKQNKEWNSTSGGQSSSSGHFNSFNSSSWDDWDQKDNRKEESTKGKSSHNNDGWAGWDDPKDDGYDGFYQSASNTKPVGHNGKSDATWTGGGFL
ncbi:hypothetical protein L484_021322 [Morus notabilis]|uniref:Uncharacterized protein n=1 Tax=Morus notabilis TaxID=981085 RepID=W9S838_9ROSA|nr:hypothetical protein L484_021322 [Morus notabilis]